MSGPNARVVASDGDHVQIEVARDLAERSGLHAGDELAAFAPGGNVLLLAREVGRKGFFVGSLETLSAAEVFGFVCSAIRSGSLILQSGPHAGGVRRRVVFRDGQVVFAASSEPSERLGSVLWRNGQLELSALQQLEPKVGPGTRLSRLLIESGLLSSAQVYRGVQLQVQEIVLAAFVEPEGEFAFIESDTPELEAVKLGMRTRDLVLEGMGRAERMADWSRQYDLGARPTRTGGAGRPEGLEQAALFERLDGTRTLRELARQTRLGMFAALRALDALARNGLVDPGAPPRPKGARPLVTPLPVSPAGAGPLELYRIAIARIGGELHAAGSPRGLESFVENLTLEQRGVFEGVKIDGGRELDLKAMQANAQRVHKGAMARAIVLDALEAFVSFALFDARNVLAPAKANELARDVNRILRGG